MASRRVRAKSAEGIVAGMHVLIRPAQMNIKEAPDTGFDETLQYLVIVVDMLFNPLFPALLLLGGASAQVSTKSLVTCITKQGPQSSASVKTTSKVLTVPWYALKVITSTPSRTTTPGTSTTTVSTTVTSSTTTTLPVETDTATLTITQFSTVPEVVTVTQQVDSTSATTITVTGTSTIPTPAGFTPISVKIPNSQRRRHEIDAAAVQVLDQRAQSKGVKLYIKNGKSAFDPVCYPQSVKCAGIIAIIFTQTRTKTASTTRVITAPTPIATSTTTFLATATITEAPPHASTTVTAFTTILTTSTSTSTLSTTRVVTSTVEVSAPQATVYAACAANNQITTVNGAGIVNGQSISGVTNWSIAGVVASATACCALCQTTTGCGGSYWEIAGGDCYFPIRADGMCKPDEQAVRIESFQGSQAYYVASNGPCGFFAPA